MNATLCNYRGKRILNVFYSTSVDGHNWSAMIEQARRLCGVEHEPLCMVCIPTNLQEAINGKQTN